MPARSSWPPIGGLPAVALAFGFVLAFGGCVTDQGSLRVAATQPLDVGLGGLSPGELQGREVVGRDTRIGSVLGVPLLDGPRLERAVDDALAQGGGNVLLGVRVRSVDYWFLVGWSTLEVRGRAVTLEPEAPR